MGIGLKIKELAGKNNITLAQLATKLGKTKQAVYEIVEKEDVNTSLLRELSSLFNVPITYFFDEGAGSAIASGKNSIAAVNSEIGGNKHLEEKVKLLERLLEEKERTIQILMNK